MKRKSFSKSFVRTVNPVDMRAVYSVVLMIVASIMLVVSALYPQFIGSVRSSATDIAAPIVTLVSKPVENVALFLGDLSGLAELQSYNIRLEQENARLREWYQKALLLEAENRSLRNLLNFKLPAKHSFITTNVISDSRNAFVKSVLVKAGENDGVQKGQAVLSGDGLIGRIIEVGTNTARVLLVSDINSRVPVLIEDTQQHGILAGKNGDGPVITRLTDDVSVNIGARIITSGRGGIFPYGLPVGRVFLDKDGEKRVKLNGDMDFIVHVRIVKKPMDQPFHHESFTLQ